MINIEKNGKIYNVNECKAKWSVALNGNKLSVAIDVPKDLCETIEELENYISTSELF